MKNTVLVIIFIIIVAAIGFWLFGGEGSEDQEDQQEVATSTVTETDEEEEESVEEESGNIQEFDLTGGMHYFSEEELTVNEGDTVRITFSSEEGLHDFVIDEFDVASEQIEPGDGEITVEFVADEAGEYEYYCSVGQHRELGMVGQLIVE